LSAGRRRRVLALLVVLLLTVAGAAPPGAGQLRHLRDVPVGPGTSFAVVDDLLLVGDGTTLAAYALPGGRPLWRVGASDLRPSAVERTGELVLTAEAGPGAGATTTVARSVATGQVRWSRPGRVLVSADRSAGFGVSEVRSLTGPGRRIEGPVVGVDLATGRPRWSVPVPVTGVVEPVPGDPARVLVLQDTGQARLLDAVTGVPVGAVLLPPADYAPDNPALAGGRLLLRHPSGPRRLVTGYDLPALTRRWAVPVDTRIDTVRACGRLACLWDGRTIRAVDPADGSARWTAPTDGWRPLPGRGTEVAVRPAAGRVRVAVLDERGVRVVGVLPAAATECRTAGSVLVCRTAADRLGVWRLPADRRVP
jgi:outer membrane protein assembly factor BamB